jgi:hypothetical protein
MIRKIYYIILAWFLPRWMYNELRISYGCKIHNGLWRCDCAEVSQKFELSKVIEANLSELKHTKLAFNQTLAEMQMFKEESALRLKHIMDWQDVYHKERIDTGKAWFNGCRAGRKSAVEWHLKEAQIRKAKKETYTSTFMRHEVECDIKMHEFMADEIKRLGESE